MSSFEYHRPDSLEAALALLGRSAPATRPTRGRNTLAPGCKTAGGGRRSLRTPPRGCGTPRRQLAYRRDNDAGIAGCRDRSAGRLAPCGRAARAAEHPPARNGGRRDRQPELRPPFGGLARAYTRVVIEPGGLLIPLEAFVAGYEMTGRLIVAVEVPAARRMRAR